MFRGIFVVVFVAYVLSAVFVPVSDAQQSVCIRCGLGCKLTTVSRICRELGGTVSPNRAEKEKCCEFPSSVPTSFSFDWSSKDCSSLKQKKAQAFCTALGGTVTCSVGKWTCRRTAPSTVPSASIATSTSTAVSTSTVVSTSTAASTSTVVSVPPPPPGSAPLFTQANRWNVRVDTLPADASSASILADIKARGGWGNSNLFQMDFSIVVLHSVPTTPFRAFTPTADFFTPDCDQVSFPVPAGGALEGEPAYTCLSNGDCHLIVVDDAGRKLYEMWRANIDATGNFFGGCAAVWELDRLYTDVLRGDQCTSADAGGFPIAGLLFYPEEVQAGAINHAIRFILPNSRIARQTYVRPATHATSSSGDPVTSIPYGTRLRLKSTFNLNSIASVNARVIARGLQQYGMILSDGGEIILTGASDRFSTVKWQTLGVTEQDLAILTVDDFEVVDFGPRLTWAGNCVRVP